MPFEPIDPHRSRGDWLTRWAFAHRGLHGDSAPENSRAAFAAAIERGLGIECDIQLSADGQPMVFHDWDLDRLSAEYGPVGKKSAEELAKVALGTGRETIPALADLLYRVAGRVPLLIEIKSRNAVPVSPRCAAVRRALAGYGGEVAVMSFDPRVARWFSAHAPEILRGLIVSEEGEQGLRGRLKRNLAVAHASPDFLAYDIRDLPSPFAARHRRSGMPVLTWNVRTRELRERAGRYADAPIAEGEGLV